MTLGNVVIVGGGQAGARAALAVRECDPNVAITLCGSESHFPYERPQLSKAALLEPNGHIPQVLDDALLATHDIAFRPDCPIISIHPDQHFVTAADGSRIDYDRLLLATGSRLRTLEIPGVDSARICYLRTLDDSRALRTRLHQSASVAVIGGGFIGLEVAAAAARLGCEVTVVEAAGHLLSRMDCPALSDSVAAHHRARGINLRLGVQVVAGDEDTLRLSDGSTIEAEVIVAGIGIIPNTELAVAAKLDVDDGIVVDSHGQTSDPSIYAAGDVTRQRHPALGRLVRLESWQNANDQADAAGRSMAGCPTESRAIPWLWSDQGDLNIQVAGLPDRVERTIVRGDPMDPDGACLLQIAGDRVVGGITINRGADMAVIRRLIEQRDLAAPADGLADPGVALRSFLIRSTKNRAVGGRTTDPTAADAPPVSRTPAQGEAA